MRFDKKIGSHLYLVYFIGQLTAWGPKKKNESIEKETFWVAVLGFEADLGSGN